MTTVFSTIQVQMLSALEGGGVSAGQLVANLIEIYKQFKQLPTNGAVL
jgi:hypothetical protein